MPLEPSASDIACALLELGRLPGHAVPESAEAELREPMSSFGYELVRARELDRHHRRGRDYVYLVQKTGYPVDLSGGGAGQAGAGSAPAPSRGAAGAPRSPRMMSEARKLQSYGVDGLTAPRAKASHETMSKLLSQAPHAVMRVMGAELDDLWPLIRAGYLLYSDGVDLKPGDLLPQAAAACLHTPHVLLGRRALLEMGEMLPDAAKCALCQGSLAFGPRCPNTDCGRAYHAECLYSTGLPPSRESHGLQPDLRSLSIERPVRCTECGCELTSEQIEFLRSC